MLQEARQTLKSAVLAQQTNNTGSPTIARRIRLLLEEWDEYAPDQKAVLFRHINRATAGGCLRRCLQYRGRARIIGAPQNKKARVVRAKKKRNE